MINLQDSSGRDTAQFGGGNFSGQSGVTAGNTSSFGYQQGLAHPDAMNGHPGTPEMHHLFGPQFDSSPGGMMASRTSDFASSLYAAADKRQADHESGMAKVSGFTGGSSRTAE